MKFLVLRRSVKVLRAKASEESFGGTLLSLGADSFQYLIGLALIGVANMVLVPLYTRYLSPEEFGIYGLIEIGVLGFITVAGLGLNVSYVKWFAEVEEKDIARLLGTQLWVGTIAAIVIGFFFAMVLRTASATEFLAGSAKDYAWAVMLLVVLESVQGLLLNHLRAARKPKAFSASSVIRLLAITIFTVSFMVYSGGRLTGLFWGRAIGDAVAVIVLVFFCRSNLSWRASRAYALGMMKYGAPLVLGALIMMVLDGSGRFFLNHYSNLHEVGIFSIGTKISSLMRLVLVMPFGVAWGGMMFQIASRPNARLIYSKLLGYLFVLSMAIAFALSLMTPMLFAIFATPAYRDAISVVPLLLIVQALTVMQYPVAIGIYLRDSTKRLAPIFLAGLACNVLVSWVLVPRYGTTGAALSWLAGWGAILIVIGITGQRKYPLDYELKPLFLGAMLALFTVLVPKLSILQFSSWWFVAQLSGSATILLLAGLFLAHDIRRMQQPYEEVSQV